jgi:hypothetical protein
MSTSVPRSMARQIRTAVSSAALIVTALALGTTRPSPLLAQGRDMTIVPGTPTEDGEDVIRVKLEDGSVRTAIVRVTAGMTKGEKALAIQLALNAKGITASVTAQENVSVADATEIVFTRVTSGETDAVAAADLIPGDGTALASIDLHLEPGFATLAGTDAGGLGAFYTAGFSATTTSFGAISLVSSFGFTDLTTPTLPGVLQQHFDTFLGQLQTQAPAMAGDLFLDLAADRILFLPSGGVTSLSATNGTTDRALSSTLGVSSSIPEPATVGLVGVGLVGVAGALGVRRGRRRPSLRR